VPAVLKLLALGYRLPCATSTAVNPTPLTLSH